MIANKVIIKFLFRPTAGWIGKFILVDQACINRLRGCKFSDRDRLKVDVHVGGIESLNIKANFTVGIVRVRSLPDRLVINIEGEI